MHQSWWKTNGSKERITSDGPKIGGPSGGTFVRKISKPLLGGRRRGRVAHSQQGKKGGNSGEKKRSGKKTFRRLEPIHEEGLKKGNTRCREGRAPMKKKVNQGQKERG